MDHTKEPLLSICIPTYNRVALLKRTLLSFENGTKEVEVIICDNSDNDESKNMVRETMKSFSGNWQYYKNTPALGPIDNLNRAVKLSLGKFIYVIHDDDYLLPNGLNTILQIIKSKPEHYVFTFGVRIVDINERSIKTQTTKKTQYLESDQALYRVLSNSTYIRQPSIVLNRNAYNEIGFWDPTKAPPDDFDMFCRLLSKYGEYRSPNVVVAYTVHENAWTEKMFNQETIRILLTIFNETKSTRLLSDKKFIKAKSSFFNQFILGGTYRSIKRLNFKRAKRIMTLFKMPELNDLKMVPKWIGIKSAFKLITAFSYSSK